MASATPKYGEYVIDGLLGGHESTPIADLRLETDRRGRHQRSAIRYRSQWLDYSGRFPLNHVHAPLQTKPIEWESREIPAIIDEVLPGGWGRVVLSRTWEQAGTAGDVDDLHAVLADSSIAARVGAIDIRPAGEAPRVITDGIEVGELPAIADAANALAEQQPAEKAVLARLQAGSSVGGARPKVLAYDRDRRFVTKFNRPGDAFNHARLEHVALRLAQAAGLDAPDSEILELTDTEALLVERFDVGADEARYPVISANALLKEPGTQRDPSHPDYEQIASLIRRYSDNPTADLRQLYGQMLLNTAINNTDDHLRNFSFRITPENGTRLTPAYDLAPSDALGAYPHLGVGGEGAAPPLPGTKKAIETAKAFSLEPAEARRINDTLQQALRELPAFLEEAELSARDQKMAERVMHQPKDQASSETMSAFEGHPRQP